MRKYLVAGLLGAAVIVPTAGYVTSLLVDAVLLAGVLGIVWKKLD